MIGMGSYGIFRLTNFRPVCNVFLVMISASVSKAQVVYFSATDGFVLPIGDTASIEDPFSGQLILCKRDEV